MENDLSMNKHLHRAKRYQTMGKEGCVNIKCRCGEKLAVGVWWSALPEGWDPIHWRLHGYRKMVDCDRRWRNHVNRLHRGWGRHSKPEMKTLHVLGGEPAGELT